MKKYRFNEGIPAFENIKEFGLVVLKKAAPLVLMRGIDTDVSFICVDFMLLSLDYDPEIGQAYLDILEAGSRQDLKLYNIMTLTSNPKDVTVNLMGPVAFNLKKKLGMQVMCKGRYSVQHKVWAELEKYDIIPKVQMLARIVE